MLRASCDRIYTRIARERPKEFFADTSDSEKKLCPSLPVGHIRLRVCLDAPSQHEDLWGVYRFYRCLGDSCHAQRAERSSAEWRGVTTSASFTVQTAPQTCSNPMLGDADEGSPKHLFRTAQSYTLFQGPP